VLRFCAVHPYDVEVLLRAKEAAGSDDPLMPAVVARLAIATSVG
jgi:hypothetical protein